MAKKQEAILKLIRDLQNQTSGKGCSEAEMEGALQAARNMMTKYGISEQEVMLSDDSDKSRIEISEVAGRSAGVITPWQSRLVSVICEICDCNAYFSNHNATIDGSGHFKKRTTIMFVGVTSDINVAVDLYEMLLVTIRTMARMNFGAGFGTKHRSYCLGFCNGLWRKMHKMREAARQAENTGAIVLKKDELIKSYMTENLNLVPSKSKGNASVDGAAYGMGQNDGRKAQLSPNSRIINTEA